MQSFDIPRSREQYVYHYTSRDTAIEYLLNENGRIRFGPLAKVNDPRESRFGIGGVGIRLSEFYMDPDARQKNDIYKTKVRYDINEHLRNHTKLLCMSLDDHDSMKSAERGFCKPRMWSQYGDNHRGVCLVFDKMKLLDQVSRKFDQEQGYDVYSGDVQYEAENSNLALMIDEKEYAATGIHNYVREKVRAHHNPYFFQKHPDWRTEEEWRCVIYGNDQDALYIDVSDIVKGIVVGLDFPAAYISLIRDAGNRLSVPSGRLNYLRHDCQVSVDFLQRETMDSL